MVRPGIDVDVNPPRPGRYGGGDEEDEVARYRVGLETRQRILDATRAVLGENGLDGTTLKAICDHAGIGAGSFYNLFDSKESAVLEVVSEAITAVDPTPGGTGDDSVTDLVDAFVAFVTGSPDLARIYLQIAVSGGLTDDVLRARVVGQHERRVERFAGAVAREDSTLDGDAAAQKAELLVAALTGLALHWLLEPSIPFAELAHRVTDARAMA